jgi:DNA-binding transcriptional regulator YiaG
MARKVAQSITGTGKKKPSSVKKNQRSAGKPDVELGKRIRLRRVEIDISQSELADKLGVSFQQVQKPTTRRPRAALKRRDNVFLSLI